MSLAAIRSAPLAAGRLVPVAIVARPFLLRAIFVSAMCGSLIGASRSTVIIAPRAGRERIVGARVAPAVFACSADIRLWGFAEVLSTSSAKLLTTRSATLALARVASFMPACFAGSISTRFAGPISARFATTILTSARGAATAGEIRVGGIAIGTGLHWGDQCVIASPILGGDLQAREPLDVAQVGALLIVHE